MAVNTSRSSFATSESICSFDGEFSTEATNEFLRSLCYSHLDLLTEAGWDVGGSDACAALRMGDYSAVVLLDPDFRDLCASDQYHLGQVLAFFGKRSDIDIGVDRKAVALGKFREAERACELTNECFRAWDAGRFQFRPAVEAALHGAQRKISQLLEPKDGSFTCPELRDIRPRFGPGASTQVPKRKACLVSKLRYVPSCSTNLLPRAYDLLEHLPWGYEYERMHTAGVYPHELVAVEPACVAFVPKNAKTDRAICTEPQLNGMFQLGLGDLLAGRLRRVGIDIRDQEPNRRASLYASISGALATLDLSSASDTVSLGLVKHLFNEAWTELFMTLRSSHASVGEDGEVIKLAKISSMGNGFTFPLETIVFWALSQAVTEMYAPKSQRRVLVYGDDIIVPTEAALPLMEVLRDLGFTPNSKKSFWTGSFRESCGKDYVFGSDVRPVFCEGPLTGADAFRIHNFYIRRGLQSFADTVREWIHPSIAIAGPDGFGDGHLIGVPWAAKPEGRKKGWGGFTFETWGYTQTSLKDELREKFARWVEKRAPFLGTSNAVEYRQQKFLRWGKYHDLLVRRIATYKSYLREETDGPSQGSVRARWARAIERIGEQPDRSGHYRDLLHWYVREHTRLEADTEVPQMNRDTDVFVTPGRGEAVRTKVYIFEPPLTY